MYKVKITITNPDKFMEIYKWICETNSRLPDFSVPGKFKNLGCGNNTIFTSINKKIKEVSLEIKSNKNEPKTLSKYFKLKRINKKVTPKISYKFVPIGNIYQTKGQSIYIQAKTFDKALSSIEIISDKFNVDFKNNTNIIDSIVNVED